MSEDPNYPRSGWTPDTIKDFFGSGFVGLKIYVDTRFETQAKETDRMGLAHQQAVALIKEQLQQIIDERESRSVERFTANDQKITNMISAQDRSVEKAEKANERRFEAVNEFRGSLFDQQNTFIPRVEVEARINALSEKIIDLASRINLADGKSNGLTTSWGVAISVLGVLSLIANLVVGIITVTHK